MKRIYISILIILSTSNIAWTQNLHLQIKGENLFETQVIDSLIYLKKHNDFKSIQNTEKSVINNLLKKGYLQTKVVSTSKINDTLILSTIKITNKTDRLGIIITSDAKNLLSLSDTIYWTNFQNLENFIQQNLSKLEKNGYSLTKIELENFRLQKSNLLADLKIQTNQKRVLNEIVINGYDNFPKSHQKVIEKRYLNKTFNKENLDNLRKSYENFRFINHTKSPEILFTKDSTKTYVYLQKSKNNTFDGYIGFSNDDEKSSNLKFNGYLDLSLMNLLDSGEIFKIYWKNDGKEQSTFDASLELPYLLNSNIGLRGNLNIFKQDSTYQNTKTTIEAGYYFNYNNKLHFGYQSTESSDISNSNSITLNDFENKFYTINYSYLKPLNNEVLFFEKLKFDIKAGTGTRNSKLNTSSQYLIELALNYHIIMNEKNRIQLQSNNFYLNSKNYLSNELYRFGGINTLRGFNENQLQGNLFTSLRTEYIHILSRNIYVNSIFDYGYYEDPTNNNSDKLLGIGFGAGITTKTGLIKINYVNGNKHKEKREFKNSIIHISFLVKF